ncbi:MAG: hypothetical protein JM58_03210 [Peptococcaceae bacterium BICA1-8]|nr:MAG: hypothetical protein JM58_03210 [Peptococcaceae bacterium BICA1-8]
MRFTKVVLVVVLILATLVLSACTENKDLPIIEVSVRVAEKGTDYCKLKWNVTNKSDITATFLYGNIEQYEVRNTTTNRKYTSEDGGKDIVLNNGDEYTNSVLLTKLDKGRYQCAFTAETEEGTKGTMRISFVIE